MKFEFKVGDIVKIRKDKVRYGLRSMGLVELIITDRKENKNYLYLQGGHSKEKELYRVNDNSEWFYGWRFEYYGSSNFELEEELFLI